METKQDKYAIEYCFIIVMTLIASGLTLISYNFPAKLMLSLFAVILIALLYIWRKKLTRNNLYLNNILNLLFANIGAYIIINYLAISIDSLIGFLAGVAVIDVLSFTRHGKRTLNAKLMSSINSIARLSICLPVAGKAGLQPIIGVGDLLYYSVITMYFVQIDGKEIGLRSALLLLTGQILNIIGIIVLKKRLKEQFKGFPATIFPGILILIAIATHIIGVV